jgi:hypothetical protein
LGQSYKNCFKGAGKLGFVTGTISKPPLFGNTNRRRKEKARRMGDARSRSHGLTNRINGISACLKNQ